MKLVTVLIDDDELVRMTWQFRAKVVKRDLLVFEKVEDFFAVAGEIDLNSAIYIDGNLGRGIRGEVVSEQIFKLGFKQIRLATGDEPSGILKPSWIIEIKGKNPPW